MPGKSVGDFSYLVLRVYSSTDELSKVLSEWFNFASSSSFYYAIRCLVRAWRETNYEEQIEPPPQREALAEIYRGFLQMYDIDYEKEEVPIHSSAGKCSLWLRRNGKQRLRSGFRIAENDLNDPIFQKAFQQTLGDLKKPFDDASRIIGEAQRQVRPASNTDPNGKVSGPVGNSFADLANAAAAFEQLKGRSIVDYVLGIKPQDPNRRYISVQADEDESYSARAREALDNNDGLRDAVKETAKAISATFQTAIQNARQASTLGV